MVPPGAQLWANFNLRKTRADRPPLCTKPKGARNGHADCVRAERVHAEHVRATGGIIEKTTSAFRCMLTPPVGRLFDILKEEKRNFRGLSQKDAFVSPCM